jgi:hypothetical protein
MSRCETTGNRPMERAGDGRVLAPDPPPDPVERMYTLEETPERRELVEVATCLVKRVPTGQLVPLVALLSRYTVDADPLELARHLCLAEPARRRG